MKIGNLLVNAAYLGSKVLTAIAVGATKVWEGVSKYIKFKDPVVEQLCMKWSSDGIGLTPEDAAKVTDIGTTFQGNTEITSFDELKYFGVKKIPIKSFNGCSSIVSISLDNIITVEDLSFVGCTSLQSIGNTNNIETLGQGSFQNNIYLNGILRLPNAIDLGHTNFWGSSITEILDLGRVSNIYYNFKNITTLTKVVLPNTCQKITGNSFDGCTSLTDINLNGNPNILNLTGFMGCPLIADEFYLPNVEEYGPNFSGAAFKKVNIGESKMTTLTMNDGNPWGRKDITEEVILPQGATESTGYVFYGYKKIRKITMPPNIRSIARLFFGDCISLEEVNLPKTIEHIGANAFLRCKSLCIIVDFPNLKELSNEMEKSNFRGSGITEVKSLGEVTLIPGLCFASCVNLKKIVLPSTVSEIGNEAFAYNNALVELILPATIPPTLGAYAFYQQQQFSVYVPDESVDAYKSATNWSAHADRIKPLSEYQPTNE